MMILFISNPLLNFFLTTLFGTFSIIGLYYTIRRKYPKSIIYVETERINLNSSVLKNYSNIKLTFNEQSIENDLYLIRGFLLNNGKIDLQKDDFENNLRINLESGKWLNCSIISTSQNLDSTCYINSENLYFESNLIKISEYIYFEALAETSATKLSFLHRIPNLGKIKTISFERLESKFLKNIIWLILTSFIVILLSTSMVSDFKSGYIFNVEYNYAIQKDFQINVSQLPNHDTIISLIEPIGTTIHILGASAQDSIAYYIHKNYDVLSLMTYHQDTIIELEAEPFGDINVSLNNTAIQDLKYMFYTNLFLMAIVVFLICRIGKNMKHILIKRKIIKTTGANNA